MPHIFGGYPIGLAQSGRWSDNTDNNRARWGGYDSLDDIGADEGGPTILLVDPWRKSLILGLDSAQAEAAGWDAIVKAGLTETAVVRTSATVVTVTLPAFASYEITAQETITATVPASAVAILTPIVAAPTFTVDAVGAIFAGAFAPQQPIPARGRVKVVAY